MNRYCDLYKELGLLSPDDHELPMHRVCANREACWAEARDRLPPDNGEMTWISQPWVGPDYPRMGLAAIGVNLNEYGGLNALTGLTEEAKALIATGHRRVRFHSTYAEYAGSFLWHRLGSYAAAIAEACGAMKVQWGKDGYPLPQNAARAFDMISFTEHVKCAPMGNKSRPTKAMWEHCGSHVLKRELVILKPSRLLILGRSDNVWRLSEHVLDSRLQDARQQGSVTCAEASVAGSSVQVLVVPHPTSFGGASRTVMNDLRKALDGFTQRS